MCGVKVLLQKEEEEMMSQEDKGLDVEMEDEDEFEEMMSQEDKGLDVEMEDEDEFLEELSIGRIVVDMNSMEVTSLKLSPKFCQLFGNDGLARADVLGDVEGEIGRLRETSIKANQYNLAQVVKGMSIDDEYMDTIKSHDKGENNGI